MTGQLLLAAATASTSTGEAVAFWILGPIAVVAALGVVFLRKTVHAALLLAVVMLALAVFYGVQQAPFLMFVQVIVYTGAVMSLFLFVLMLVGVDADESLKETLRGQRVAGVLLALGFGILLIAAIGHALAGTGASDLAGANSGGNVYGLARNIFGPYVLAFEVTSALLITAAMGAMVLTHRERLVPRTSQRDLMRERFRSDHPTPLPSPGVYANHNAVDTPALLPDGTPAESSVPDVVAGVSAERFPEPARMGLGGRSGLTAEERARAADPAAGGAGAVSPAVPPTGADR